MRKVLISFLPAILIHFAAFGTNEGVPVYYQKVRNLILIS